jgi:C-terminal processing protease CtpA/Prc
MKGVSNITKLFVLAAAMGLASAPAYAELTRDQRVHEFENLTGLYARTYAPTVWKRQLLGVDVFDVGPWFEAVRNAKSDLEYMEICLKYVATFRDTHTNFFWQTNYSLDSGLLVDLFDGKVLVEFIDRSLLPASSYPIFAGDEIVAIDGKPVAQIMDEFLPLLAEASDRFRRRNAANYLTYRPQGAFPRVVDMAPESVFQIKQPNGRVTSYTITWDKFGYPVRQLGTVAQPRKAQPGEARAAALHDNPNPWFQAVALSPIEARRARWAERAAEPDSTIEGSVYYLGQRAPIFSIPGNFTVRRGRVSTDNFYTATYDVAGKRLGYLRIPSFSPASQTAALTELANEIIFFQANTDGLVVDVTNNPGGDLCYERTVLTLLIPYKFTNSRWEVRPSLRLIGTFSSWLETAKANLSPQVQIDTWQNALNAVTKAYDEGINMTAPLPVCAPFPETDPASAGTTLLAYTKPLIVLTDEMTISAGDTFASVMQDNKRGPIVGVTTAGAGGSVIGSYMTGVFSETFATSTNSLIVRKAPVSYPGLPATSYIENVGVRPDINLEHNTVANLNDFYRTWVNDFTGVIVGLLLQP